jgi:hypothetical protein
MSKKSQRHPEEIAHLNRIGGAGAEPVRLDSDQFAAVISTEPRGSLTVRVPWDRQNAQPDARSDASCGR